MSLKKTNLVKKPWGYYINLYKDKNFNIKIIKVNPNSRLSLQYHKEREEKWILIDGIGFYQIGKKRAVAMKENKIYQIKKKQLHRLIGGKKGCQIIEISLGKFLESDVVRIEDDYKRNL